ncbi:hypothetical protein GCM10029992_66840 [Glycomyces albus]
MSESANAADVERLACDVLVIGAGGAGLRAAVEARLAGKSVIVVSKSLFGKAHTVMAEGGAAAAMGNVNDNDNWQVHFRDTMRGGKFLNNYRMAELHAKEAPERIWELETYGALFDRTPTARSASATSAATSTRAWPTSATAPAWSSSAPSSRNWSRSSRRTGARAANTTRNSRSSTRPRSPSCCCPAARSRAPSATAAAPALSWRSRRPRSCWPPAVSVARSRSPRTPGSTPGTATRWRCGPGRG